MIGFTDYSNRGNSSRLLLQVCALCLCCILTVLVILKGETGSFFAMKATVLFSIESDQELFGHSGPDVTVFELYGDVHPLSKSKPLIIPKRAAGEYGHTAMVHFPIEAVGKSLNYRIVLRSDTGYDRSAIVSSGTVSLNGGKSIVVINEADLKAGSKIINHPSGQLVDLR